MSLFSDLLGTIRSAFTIGLGSTGLRLKNISSALALRNAGDTADAPLTTSQVNISGNALVLNSGATESGASWKQTLQRPSTGMTADYALTLPVADGTSGQVMSTNGDGTTAWVSAANTAQDWKAHSTALAFGTASPVTLFTLPANAIIESVEVIVDTAFNGTPTVSVGVSGTTSKYMGTGDSDLTAAAATSYEVHPNATPDSSSEALIATYSAGGASAGAARIIVNYSVPTSN